MIHPYFQKQADIFPQRYGVWQHVAPQDYRDRMAQEGAPATPPQGYPLTDHGGSVIPEPKLALVYLGAFWGDPSKLEAFATDLMDAGYLQPLADYKYGSGQGKFIGAFHGPAAVGTVQDAQLQSALQSLITAGTVPAPDDHTLYVLVLPQGVTVDQGGQASCQAFCGYHDGFQMPSGQNVYYSVQTSPECQGCLPSGDQPFDILTAVIAHEVAEACTDAIPGQGWYNDATGMENADEWAWIFFKYGPWNVQGYQVNGVGNSESLIKYAQPNPAPQPQPQPQPQGCQATADAEFDVLLAVIGNGPDPWSRAGVIWVTWAKQNVEAAIAATAAGITPGTFRERTLPAMPEGFCQEMAA